MLLKALDELLTLCSKPQPRLVVWFSCGAASACALKLVAHRNPVAIYCDTSKSENKDNARFRAEVEQWTGVKIQTIGNPKYSTVEEVFEAKRYMSGIAGAPCTVQLKKVPRFAFQRADDIHVFGYTVNEKRRIKLFQQNNHELILEWPLVEAEMNKQSCYEMIVAAGIRLPIKYEQGFSNNNCDGCVKSESPAYWNLVRKHTPEVFDRRCEQSRRFGARLVRLKGVRIFLDELPHDADEAIVEDLSCGPHCAPNSDDWLD